MKLKSIGEQKQGVRASDIDDDTKLCIIESLKAVEVLAKQDTRKMILILKLEQYEEFEKFARLKGRKDECGFTVR